MYGIFYAHKIFMIMNLKGIIREEIDDFGWIKDQDPNNVHITDLKLGQVVMINCPKFQSFKNRKFTVDEIRTNLAKYKKGDICVHFKEMDKIQYPFGTDSEPNIPGMTMCEHLGCNFKLIKDINESDDLKWITEIPNSIVAGSCIKSSKGVDWTIEHIHVPTNTVIVKSKKGHGQLWDLTALYIQNREGKLKLCTGETVPPNSVPTPDHLQYPKDVNESNDMGWISDTNPSRSDLKVFKRKHILDNYETTLMYGNDVKVGDQFLPTHSDTIWTVENIKKDKDNPSRKHTSYFVRLRDDAGKTRREEWYPQPFTTITKERHKDNGLPGTFPRMNMYKWRKILTKPNLKESNDMEWISDVRGIEVGFCYSYFIDEPLVIERIRAKRELDGHPFSEYYDIKSINELDPDEYEDTTIYSRNYETGYISTVKLDMLIKNLTQGKFHPC
tara:strand:- start:458 stop:1786 length:1329 start_codon:yes stop_codon:yes gene_type:complete